MARAGRKRKEGDRQPDGRLRPPTMKVLNELNARETEKITEVVRMQPHRRDMGHIDANKQAMLHSPLGRFCLDAGCSEATYEGVFEYAALKLRWSAAKGKPRGLEQFGPAGCGAGPTEEQVRKWEQRIREAHQSVVGCHELGANATFVLTQVHRLAVEHLELRPDIAKQSTPMIRMAMGQIAASMGALSRFPHPFT